nr:TPM domain-containing protein [Sphingomonas sp. NFR04]
MVVATRDVRPLPELTGRVVDNAHLLSAEAITALSQRLAVAEARTCHQLVVVTVPSLVGESIESLGLRLLNGWGIGRRFYDDGVLLLIAPNERRARIEVGFGLENSLTDAEAVMILHRDVIPRFRAGDWNGGIDAAVTSILREIS